MRTIESYGFVNEQAYKQVMNRLNDELNCKTLMVNADDETETLTIYVDDWYCCVNEDGLCCLELEPTKKYLKSTDCENLSAIVQWAKYLYRTAFDAEEELPF